MTRPQWFWAIGLLTLLATIVLILGAMTAAMLTVGALTLTYAGAFIFKSWLVPASLTRTDARGATENEQRPDDKPPAWFTSVPHQRADGSSNDGDTLPTYSILVPLHREGRVLAQLVTNLRSLDYPEDKLQVLLLLESDDDETLSVARTLDLPPGFEIIVLPNTHPRTKPKACNIGLAQATGEYCVVYDAEDHPDPDQLKKAVAAFRSLDPATVCLQAKLAYHNPNVNFLTRMGAAEYAMYFDLVLPGLASRGLPVPLGGTSNHFRTASLRDLGGWDSYNVTEDIDLGMRIARAGLRVAVIDSVTWEEATSGLGNWIRQRSRWIKGHMQTYCVHMRSPRRLLRELGPSGFVAFQLLVVATPLMLLANPLFWALTILYLVTRASFVQTLYPTPLLYVGVVSMVVGNLGSIYFAMTGCMRARLYGNVKWVVLGSLPYWVLMSMAAWKAAYQMLVKPHYWEKTDHGFNPRVAGAMPSAPSTTVESMAGAGE